MQAVRTKGTPASPYRSEPHVRVRLVVRPLEVGLYGMVLERGEHDVVLPEVIARTLKAVDPAKLAAAEAAFSQLSLAEETRRRRKERIGDPSLSRTYMEIWREDIPAFDAVEILGAADAPHTDDEIARTSFARDIAREMAQGFAAAQAEPSRKPKG